MMRALSLSAMVACWLVLATHAAFAQDPPAISHAKRVIDLLVRERFDEVTGDFNAQISAVLPAAQLRTVWTGLIQQVGPFVRVLDARVQPAPNDVTAAVLGCQFERTALNAVVAFDADGRIAGLQFVPRQPPRAAAPEPPPATSRFTEDAVTVGPPEWALPGTLSIPRDPIVAAIVLVHGSGPRDRDETLGPNKPLRDLAWGLANRGVAVLRYEKRTRQYPSKLAALPNMTVREETTEDAVAAAALLRLHPKLGGVPVFVLGHSLGGTLAPRIAQSDSALAGLVILAGAVRPILDVAREQLAYLASFAPASAADQESALEALRHSAPESYWKDLDSYRPAETAAALKLPMLILQGERDYQASMVDFALWRRALESHTNVTFKSYAALNHLFMDGHGKSVPAEYDRPGHVSEAVIDDIAAWLKDAVRR
jgi:hypothetical protein